VPREKIAAGRNPLKVWLTLVGILGSVVVAQSAGAQSTGLQTSDSRPSSERVKADPAGQYVLIKSVAATLPAPARRTPRGDPDGYDLAGYCWAPEYVMGDWAKPADLAGRLLMVAMETTVWSRELAVRGFPVKPLSEAIGRYEGAMVAAGATDAARQRGHEALVAELEALRRASPGAPRVQLSAGCSGPTLAVQLRYKTVPEGGRARFIAKALHEICRVQGIDANDSTRCDYWLENPEAEPRFFMGDYVWSARWPDDRVVQGEFDARSISEPGVVTLRQGIKR
jgi:hypothetical protein